MLCYIFVEKRSVNIKRFINWSLFDNNNLLISYKKVLCNYNNNVILFNEDISTVNEIDLNKKIYRRTTKEMELIIDFNSKKLMYIEKEHNYQLTDYIKCNIKSDDRIINIEYEIDGIKKIIVELL